MQIYEKVLGISVSLLLSIFITLVIGYLSFYVHEIGHIVFGSIGSIMHGEIPVIGITNWIDFLWGFKVPQQTSMPYGVQTPLFVFGGIIAVISVAFAISSVLYKKSTDKFYFLLPAIFAFHEIFGNLLCGTDNLTNNPYFTCSSSSYLQYWPYIYLLALVGTITVLLYPIISKISKKN